MREVLMQAAVWVQFTVKGKKSWWQKSSSFEISNLPNWITVVFFFVLRKISFHRLFCPIPQPRPICSSFEFRSYYDKSDDFEQEEPRKNMEIDLHGFPSQRWVGNQMLAHMSL